MCHTRTIFGTDMLLILYTDCLLYRFTYIV